MIKKFYIEYSSYNIYCQQNIALAEQTPVIFLHGLGSALDIYSKVLDVNCLQGNLLMIDLLGHGQSDKPLGFSYDLLEQASCINTVIEKLGFEKVNIVAHSMGGVIAILFTKMFPHKLNKLILAEASLSPKNAKISQKIVGYGSEEGFIQEFESFIESFNRPNRLAAFRFYNTLRRSTPYSIYRSASSLLKHVQQPFYKEFLDLKVSRYFINGQESYQNISDQMKKDLDTHNIQLFTIPRAGHSMMEDNPKEFYDVICKILNGI